MKLNSAVARSTLLVLLFLMQPASIAFADDVASVDGPLACQIEYWSVVRDDVRNDDGWLLAWKAKVSGDFEGELRWWFPETPPAPEGEYSDGKVGYYVARWQLWQGDELVLAGESAGKTVMAEGEDGIWDGHGIVMQATGELSSLKGRKIYETGTVIMPADPEVPSTGSGMWVIY